MEFLVGGVAASAASFFTNPLEVVKTRLQLQGELKARGHYAVIYRNVFHAFLAIGRVDGVLALQKGLVPAVWYQFVMNGARLGAYQWMVNRHMLTNADGMLSLPRCIVAGALAGSLGSFIASPAYMVKTQLQAMATKEIAVGYQHSHKGMADALTHIYSTCGVRGLWRGVSGAVSRVMVGSAAQLSTFSSAKQYIIKLQIFRPDSYMVAFIASMFSGVNTVLFMTPFDVISTRLYNQGTDAHGKGLNYHGVLDCFTKVFCKEGVGGFYKGWQASLFRVGPHTVLSLIFWDELQKFSTRKERQQ